MGPELGKEGTDDTLALLDQGGEQVLGLDRLVALLLRQRLGGLQRFLCLDRELVQPHPRVSPSLASAGGASIHRLASPAAAARTAAPRRPAARPTRVSDSPRGARRRASAAAARLALPGSQTRLAARVAEPPRPPLGSHYPVHRLASRRASPSLRGRRSARTTRITDSPRRPPRPAP